MENVKGLFTGETDKNGIKIYYEKSKLKFPVISNLLPSIFIPLFLKVELKKPVGTFNVFNFL